ncbi:esterase-like activity of phytase family protein [Consotaella aegiceratis]|uniref:esterase-like activity of phytase family protein n=1 Tax=Consotaella aegiceratis TaxID=3097961 RepID=UPI002F3E5A97
MRGRTLGLAAASVALVTAACAQPHLAAQPDITITASSISQFQPGSTQTRFGSLDFVGGLKLASSDVRFSGLSSFRFTAGRSHFLVVTDTGYWVTGDLRRDPQGRPAGIDDARLFPILDTHGQPAKRKRDADAEALAVVGDKAFVAFESDARIEAFDYPLDPAESRPQPVKLPVPRGELRRNKGLEMLAAAPSGSRLHGSLVTVSEHSIDSDGNLFAAIFDADHSSVFKVRRDENWDVTDGAFLPDGDLLLLERRFTGILSGIGMRIRRVDGRTIQPGALVDGPIIMQADLGQEIDNMEGLEVSVGDDGKTYLTLISDDNGNFFQRTLLLEFRLADDRSPATN